MASGNSLGSFFPANYEPPATLYALLSTRAGQPILRFDGSAEWDAIWTFEMPSQYAGGGIQVIAKFTFASATSGTANVEFSVERGATDMDADSFDTMTDASVTPNATAGIVTTVTVNLANNDSIVAGDKFRLKMHRDSDGSNGTDDITTEMEFVSGQLKEI